MKNFLALFILVLIVGVGAFIYMSPVFEKKAPQINLNSSYYWNGKDKLNFSLYDDSGIKSYKVTYQDGQNNQVLTEQTILTKQEKVIFNIDSLKVAPNVKSVTLTLEVFDKSLWNFFQGNQTKKQFTFDIDKKKPIARVVSNSYNIRRGGSAAIVVEVKDENLKDKYITFNDKYRFELIPYVKDGFYAAIIAWPIDITMEQFNRVDLVAIDMANNVSVAKVPLYIKDLKIKRDNLKISDSFVNKVSIPVLEKSDFEVPSNTADIFIKQNSELRQKNVDTIRSESINNMSKEMISNFKIKPFRRLPGSKTFAGFAERRSYFYEGSKIDEAWHLGMDWASIRHADIKVTNSGKVVFNDYLGIYGNTMIIDHGFGLQSLYAHTSRFIAQKGENVKAGQVIANTGSTGAVFGDHLHFGVLIQGIEVNPLEWMDNNWIKTRIYNILDEARQEIRSSK